MIELLLALESATPPAAPSCLTQAQALVKLSELGGEVVGSAHYAGSVTSDMLIVQLPDSIIMVGFNAVGCYVGQITVEAAKPRTGA